MMGRETQREAHKEKVERRRERAIRRGGERQRDLELNGLRGIEREGERDIEREI